MKWLLGLALLGGCAKGSAPLSGGDDAPSPQPDTPFEQHIDAAIDAPPMMHPDAPIDAFVPIDSPAVTPDAPADACVKVASEKLVNPALDLTPTGTGWTGIRDPNVNDEPGGPFPMIMVGPIASQSAPDLAWFGGAAGDDVTPAAASLTDQLFQDITFPADATNFVVSGFYLIGTQEDPTSPAFDTFSMDVTETNGTPIENVLKLDNTVVAGSFTPFTKTLSSNLAGKTVRLRMVSINDSTLLTNFFLDTLSFKATFCP